MAKDIKYNMNICRKFIDIVEQLKLSEIVQFHLSFVW